LKLKSETADLSKAPRRLRGPIQKQTQKPTVERDGGRWGCGIIRGVSLCTRGEALGHWVWLDQTFIEQVYEGLEKAGERGLKGRFTHPDMSADGLGHYLGRYDNGSLSDDGSQVFADFHFAPSAHETPDGDLAEYLMQRADEDPESFGLSIVFEHDEQAESEFVKANRVEVEKDGETEKRWRSPDADNKRNLRHARLKILYACDAVDEPAANPGGLFHSRLMLDVERTAEFALGLSESPGMIALDVDAERLRGFVERFLASHKLKLVSAEDEDETEEPGEICGDSDEDTPTPVDSSQAPSDESPGDSPAPPEPDADLSAPLPPDKSVLLTREEIQRWHNQFGADAMQFLADGLSWDEALAKLAERTKEENDGLRAELAELRTKLTAAQTTGGMEEPTPLGVGDDRTKKPKRFEDLFKIRKR
jgi:hypothetical protein